MVLAGLLPRGHEELNKSILYLNVELALPLAECAILRQRPVYWIGLFVTDVCLETFEYQGSSPHVGVGENRCRRENYLYYCTIVVTICREPELFHICTVIQA